MIGSALFSIYRNKEIPDDMPPLVIFVSTEEEKNDLIDAMLLLKMPNLEQDANINHFLKLSKYQSQIVVSPDVAESLSNYLLENDEEDLI